MADVARNGPSDFALGDGGSGHEHQMPHLPTRMSVAWRLRRGETALRWDPAKV
jgi:hypothetical protein